MYPGSPGEAFYKRRSSAYTPGIKKIENLPDIAEASCRAESEADIWAKDF